MRQPPYSSTGDTHPHHPYPYPRPPPSSSTGDTHPHPPYPYPYLYP